VFGCVCVSWPGFWTDPIGEERIIEPVRELEAASVGEIFFYLPNDGACQRIEEPRREIVSRYEQPFQRVGAELTSLSAFIRRTQSTAQRGSSMLWIDYRRRRSPPMACRASFSMSRTFPWAPAPDASRMSPCPRTITNTS
jgi:hypothetical protein